MIEKDHDHKIPAILLHHFLEYHSVEHHYQIFYDLSEKLRKKRLHSTFKPFLDVPFELLEFLIINQ